MRAFAGGLLLCLFAAVPASADLTQDELREVETLLARLGFDPGPVDGVADAETAIAIESYQTFAALRVDGVASAALLQELRGVTESLGPAEAEGPGEAPAASPAKTAAADDGEDPTRQAAEAEAPRDAGAREDRPWTNAVHLASFRQAIKAEKEWQRLQQRLPSLLGDMDPKIDEIDLAGEGLFYRLYAGPFPNQATAQDFCAVLSLEGYNCGVARGALQVARKDPPLSDGGDGQDEQLPAEPEPAAQAAPQPPVEPPAEPAATALLEPGTDPQTPDTTSTPPETPAPDPLEAADAHAAEEPAGEAAAAGETAEVEASDSSAGLPPPSEDPGEPAQVAAAPTAEDAETGTADTPTASVASNPLGGPSTDKARPSVGAPLLLVPEAEASGPTVLIAASRFASAAPEGLQETAPSPVVEPGESDAGTAAESGEFGEPPTAAPAREAALDAPQSASLVATGADDFAAATAAFELGDCENALQSYAQALEKGGLPRRQASAGHNNRGRCLYDLARYYEALAELNKAIGIDRAYAAAYYNRGRVHNALGNSAKARSDLKAAYDLGFGRLQAAE